MAKSIITEGKTSTEAIEKGLKELNTTRENVNIKILEEKKKSFFSILDPHVVKVELTLIEKDNLNKINEKKEVSKDQLDVEVDRIRKFLNEFLPLISKNIKYNINVNNKNICVDINGEDSAKLIGYRGEALNSLQLVISTIARNNYDSSAKVLLNIENYREKREKTLENLAIKIAKTVNKTGKKVTLEPMNAYERKIIHTVLQNSEYVTTYSIGENDNRRVVIEKK